MCLAWQFLSFAKSNLRLQFLSLAKSNLRWRRIKIPGGYRTSRGIFADPAL